MTTSTRPAEGAIRQTRVIGRLYGGLGNQMFQYASGRALALRRGGERVLDRRDSRACPWQVPRLDHSNIVCRPARASDLSPPRSPLLRHAPWRLLKQQPRPVRERDPGSDPDLLDHAGHVCLRGTGRRSAILPMWPGRSGVVCKPDPRLAPVQGPPSGRDRRKARRLAAHMSRWFADPRMGNPQIQPPGWLAVVP